MSKITIQTLKAIKQRGERFACLTAYDASFAQLIAEADVEVLLVGDSLGMVVQGKETTLPVTMEEMIYHTANVTRSSADALVMADMPFMGDSTPELALHNAGRLMKEGGAQVVKLEGGQRMLETVATLADRGIPVCSHLGLLPQSVHKVGGYKVQGKDPATADIILEDAKAIEQAGADILLLECVPAALAHIITQSVTIPVIGIGAGPGCDGQVLVCYDMLGITPGKRPKFSKDFLQGKNRISEAFKAYGDAVKSGEFPAPEHCF